MRVDASRPSARPRRRAALAALGVVVALLAGGCAGGVDAGGTGPSPSSAVADDAAPAELGTALAALDELPIKGRAPKTGYEREQFGPAWADVDRNGCDTRNDILARDLTRTSTDPDTHDCLVLTGVLADPYTATTIDFLRGQATSTAVQIDHVVALSDAWQKGAQQLDAEARRRLANDPLNLLAVDGPTNSGKSDGDAATWLPPNKAFRCQYVARQVAVKQEYDLWVTQAEHDAVAGVLARCPDEPLPTGGLAPRVDPAGTAPEPHESQSADPEEEPSGTPFANCTEAQEAGAAPVHRGDPGYSSRLDRDGDGVGCE